MKASALSNLTIAEPISDYLVVVLSSPVIFPGKVTRCPRM